MENPASPRRRQSLFFCLVLLGGLFVALLWRLPYGFDWSDEAYQAVVPYRFVLGDRPIIDTWEVHQFSGLIALPFLRLFLLFTGGSTQGVLLFFRFVNVILQGLVALYGFFVLRRKSGDLPAVLAGGLILMHAHYAMNNFFYNSMTLLFLILSVLLLFDGLDRLEGRCLKGKAPFFAALAGASYALAVQAYPYLLISLPVWIAYWILFLKRHAQRPARRFPLYFISGLGAVLVAFIAYLLIRCPLPQLLQNLPYLFADPDHTATNVLRELAAYLNAVRVLFGPVSYGALALCLLGAAALWIPREPLRTIIRRIGLGLALGLILGAVLWIIPYDYPNYHKINLAAMALSLIAPGLYVLSGKKKDRSMLLFFLGCALSIAVQIGSNTRVRASTGMMLPASIAALLYLFDSVEDLWDGAGTGLFRAFAAAVCALQLALVSGLRLTTVYRDDPIPSLTCRLESGPAKGLVTTPESAAAYDALCRDIAANAPKEGTILLTNLMPLGYLLTSLSPATPSAYNMTMDAGWLSLYLSVHPERRPDYIFASDKAYGVSNQISMEGAESTYLADPDYQVKKVSTGTVFLRVRDGEADASLPPANDGK